MLVRRAARHRRLRRQSRGVSAPRVLRWAIAASLALAGIFTLLVLVGAGAGVLLYWHYARELPPPEAIIAAEEDAFLTTVLYDRTGQTAIYEVVDPLGGARRWLRLDAEPGGVLQARVDVA